jgi:biopolymer transport protein ExbB
VLAIIEAAGWPIWAIILASVVALGIIGERLWSLRASEVAPAGLLDEVAREWKQSGCRRSEMAVADSPLGRVFAAS